MNKKAYFILVVVIILLISVFIYKTSKATEPANNKVVIGAVLSLSGSTSSFYGEYNKNAIDLFVKEINKKGGIDGRKLEVVYQDSKGDKAVGLQAFNFLVNQGIKYVISDVSPVSVALAPIAQKEGVVLIATSASNPALTDAGDFIFRTKMSAVREGDEAGLYIANTLKPKSVAFLYQNDDYGNGVFKSFSPKVRAGDIPIVSEEKFHKEAVDMRTELLKIKQNNPELVILAGYPKQIGRILKQAGEMGLQTKFFAHGGSIGPDIDQIAGIYAKGLTNLTELNENTKEFQDFRLKYSKEYKVEPELFSANAYDAITLLANSIGQCGAGVVGRDSTVVNCVKDTLAKTKAFQGVAGNITFDQNGDLAERELVLMTR